MHPRSGQNPWHQIVQFWTIPIANEGLCSILPFDVHLIANRRQGYPLRNESTTNLFQKLIRR